MNTPRPEHERKPVPVSPEKSHVVAIRPRAFRLFDQSLISDKECRVTICAFRHIFRANVCILRANDPQKGNRCSTLRSHVNALARKLVQRIAGKEFHRIHFELARCAKIRSKDKILRRTGISDRRCRRQVDFTRPKFLIQSARRAIVKRIAFKTFFPWKLVLRQTKKGIFPTRNFMRII